MSLTQELWHIGVNVPTHNNFDPLDRANQRAMNADFAAYSIDSITRRVLHGAMKAIFKPEISGGRYSSYIDGFTGEEIESDNEDIFADVEKWLADGNSLIVVGNHLWLWDHINDAAGLSTVPELSEIPERGRILAKDEYFDINAQKDKFGNDKPPTSIQKILNYGYRVLNAIPITRPKDLERKIQIELPDDFGNMSESEKNKKPASGEKERRNKIIDGTLICNDETMKGCINILRNEDDSKGGILEVYMEGERMRGDWAAIGNLTDLVPRLLQRIELENKEHLDDLNFTPLNVAVLVMARSYGTTKEKHSTEINARRSHIHLGAFLRGSFAHKGKTKKRIGRELQNSLNTAHCYSLGHEPIPIDPDLTPYQSQYPLRFDRKTNMIVREM